MTFVNRFSTAAGTLGTAEVLDAVPQAAAGSARLFVDYGPTVARWARRLGGPLIDAEDVVQEVFEAVHQRLPKFRGEAHVVTWIYSITSRTVRRHRARGREAIPGGFASEVAGHLPDLAAGALERVSADDARRLVYAALDALNDSDRELIILFEIEGLSGAQIAELRGMRLNAVWTGLQRARRIFVAVLNRLLGEPPK